MDGTELGVLAGAIVTAGGAIATAIKFGFSRSVRHQDESAKRARKSQDVANEALIANAAAFHLFANQLDRVDIRLEELCDRAAGREPIRRNRSTPMIKLPSSEVNGAREDDSENSGNSPGGR